MCERRERHQQCGAVELECHYLVLQIPLTVYMFRETYTYKQGYDDDDESVTVVSKEYYNMKD